MIITAFIITIVLFAMAFIKQQSKFKEEWNSRKVNFSKLPSAEGALEIAVANAEKISKKSKTR